MTRRELAFLILLLLELASVYSLNIQISRSLPTEIIVPDQFSTIQEAINNANEGDVVFINAGTYYEHIVVNKTISLVGEDSNTTIIDGNGTGIVVHIARDAVNVTGLSIRESGCWPEACIALDNVKNCVISANIVDNNNKTSVAFVGIFLHSSERNTITGNDVRNNPIGINVRQSSSNTVIENRVTHAHLGIQVCNTSNNNLVSGNNLTDCEIGVAVNQGSQHNRLFRNQIECSNETGIGIGVSSNNNLVVANAIADSYYGIRILSSSNNTLYHNRIIDNNIQGYVTGGYTNQWDNGYPSGGNYWSNCNKKDLFSDLDQNQPGSDGIGDTPYAIDSYNIDNYPLIGMLSEFKVISESTVQTISNSTIYDFQFNGTAVSFNVSGEDDTIGFCRICIPTAMMNATYRVFINRTEVSCRVLPFSNSTLNYVYFTYSHSIQEVIIIPEFPSFLILPLFMMATLPILFLYKRKMSART
jgi:parallel beta-helix repeat protein